MKPFEFQSINGTHLQLKPMIMSDINLAASSLISPTTWFSKTRNINSVEKFSQLIVPLLQKQVDGRSLLIKAMYQNEIVALSQFKFTHENTHQLEIGFTWIADKWQRTFVNSELKLLMLSYAFETLKVIRVEFSVHPTNDKSNRAMIRLGAKLEGTLRKWRVNPNNPQDDGDRNIYSILDDEWPKIKQKLTNS